MKLDSYIAMLLYDHDCVVIPGFGGFIGNPAPARLFSERTAFYPPYKAILFNHHLKQNDGLLAHTVASGENIPYFDAMNLILTETGLWEKQLAESHHLELDNIGALYRNDAGILLFEQYPRCNYLPSAFGLDMVVSPVVQRAVTTLRTVRSETLMTDVAAIRKPLLPKPLKWAAILALPIGISAILGIQNFDRLRDFSSAYSGWYSSRLDPFHRVSPNITVNSGASGKTIHLVTPVQKKIAKSNTVAISSQPKSTPVPGKEMSKPVVSASFDQPFAIIVGAFRFRDNADNLVAKLQKQGFDAAIIDTTRTGLFRVRIQAFHEKSEAIAQLAVIRSESFPGAWLLQK